MARWDPHAEERLRAAAMALFADLGYDQTSVAAIAERAGLTSRTFFRYFADKKEVLFHGSSELQKLMVEALAHAPAAASPVDAMAASLTAVAGYFDDGRRTFARQRHAIVAANAELHEREVMKLSRLSAALAVTLRERGMAEPDASLVAESTVAVFHVSFRRWVARGERRSLHDLVLEALQRWQRLAAQGDVSHRSARGSRGART
jgi:AcrR family transcriptional regulator